MPPFRVRRTRVVVLAAVVVCGVYKFGFPSLTPPPPPPVPIHDENGLHIKPPDGPGAVGDIYPGSPPDHPPPRSGPGSVHDVYIPNDNRRPEDDGQESLTGATDPHPAGPEKKLTIVFKPSSFNWSEVPEFYPIEGRLTPLPTAHKPLPRVQHDFGADTFYPDQDASETESRRIAVKSAFLRCWDSYRNNASSWMRDELLPVSGGGKTTFGGWSATLVDSLDTLWIMGLEDEFREAAAAAASLDFANTTETAVNMFETTIRHLGGLLSAYDLSGEEALKLKAVELGDMLYHAFDTHNRMPNFWFVFKAAKNGNQKPGNNDPSASPGSLSMEFARLSQITGDMKYYDAVARIKSFLQETQQKTKLPGMWPTRLNFNLQSANLDHSFTIGAAADSLYEYLLKTHVLLGAADHSWLEMYETAMGTVEKYLLFSPMIPPSSNHGKIASSDSTAERKPGYAGVESDVVFAGSSYVRAAGPELQPETQHLTCFAGGMFALGGRILGKPHHLDLGTKITRGCTWAYDATATGIMPEVFNLVPCRAASSATSSVLGWLFGSLFSSSGSTTGMVSNGPQKATSKPPAGFLADEDHTLTSCEWDERLFADATRSKRQHKPPGTGKNVAHGETPKGMSAIRDFRYILRPEAIESVFVLYRVTGDPELRNVAWRMFAAITKATKTKLANSAIKDVTVSDGEMMDSMEVSFTQRPLHACPVLRHSLPPLQEGRKEGWMDGWVNETRNGRHTDNHRKQSFWLAETLKYFYLIFSPPDLISLDHYVFNTEAHPLKRPRVK
ncbi:glycoside hydrolase family 47 protein [Zalerion maritima]|uniref:alpha-1,2-Mannosidase n=1 Tax=Zalerion maritima TaxID=339359 RepID=A0AAD5RWH2_9PEZI|nr:glycoside hydrolase family 47 protein [Zalerion maritima]